MLTTIFRRGTGAGGGGGGDLALDCAPGPDRARAMSQFGQ